MILMMNSLRRRKEEFQKQFGKDVFTAALLDVTNA